MRKLLKTKLDFLAYCLMPNNFHFLIVTLADFKHGDFANEFKIMLSSYSQAINKQEKRSGSLFQQNSKSKCLTYETSRNTTDYGLICFNYIHQNPVVSGLVNKIEDWEFSSFKDFIGLRKGTLCNKNLAIKLFNLPLNSKDLYDLSYAVIKNKLIRIIY